MTASWSTMARCGSRPPHPPRAHTVVRRDLVEHASLPRLTDVLDDHSTVADAQGTDLLTPDGPADCRHRHRHRHRRGRGGGVRAGSLGPLRRGAARRTPYRELVAGNYTWEEKEVLHPDGACPAGMTVDGRTSNVCWRFGKGSWRPSRPWRTHRQPARPVTSCPRPTVSRPTEVSPDRQRPES